MNPKLTKEQFIAKHRVGLAKAYYDEFTEALQECGLNNFDDYSDLMDDAQRLTAREFGIDLSDEDAGDQIEEVFDYFADYMMELRDEVITLMLLDYYSGLQRKGEDPYGEA